jgi:hypothetical protein
MALDDDTFAQKLKVIFDVMDGAAGGTPKTNQWYAEQLAKAIDDQIKTADVNAGIGVAGGTQSGGPPAGAKTSAKGSLS